MANLPPSDRTTMFDMSVEPVQPQSLAPGREAARIGRFAVLERIGTGGMGEVYAAYDEQLDRKVALKLLPREPNLSAAARTRQLREARALARLSHPNVVKVFDVGVYDGEFFIAMEFIRGSTLRQWLKLQRRSWAEILRVFIALGEGLAAMHEHDLVHRDVKPDNALVDDDGGVRLIDFGLVKQLDTPTELNSAADSGPVVESNPVHRVRVPESLTRTGAFVGTLLYTSPEQLKREPSTPASDQFSFCMALFEALFGYLPFAGDSPQSRVFEMLHGTIQTPPPDATIPSELLDVVCRGLRRDPEERWPDMGQLLAVLRGLLSTYDAEVEDPKLIRSQNRLNMTLLVIFAVVLGIFSALLASDIFTNSLQTQVVIDAMILFIVSTGALASRSRWMTQRHSRVAVGLFLFLASLYFLQNFVGYLVGRSLYHCLVNNLVCATLVMLFGAPMFISSLRWCGLWAALWTTITLLDPPRAPVYFGVANLGAAVVGSLVMPRRSRQRWAKDAANEGREAFYTASGTQTAPLATHGDAASVGPGPASEHVSQVAPQ